MAGSCIQFPRHVSRFIEPVGGLEIEPNQFAVQQFFLVEISCGKGRLVLSFKGAWSLVNVLILLSDAH